MWFAETDNENMSSAGGGILLLYEARQAIS